MRCFIETKLLGNEKALINVDMIAMVRPAILYETMGAGPRANFTTLVLESGNHVTIIENYDVFCSRILQSP